MSTASRGAARERQAKKLLEDEGWAVVKAGGSFGCADLWAAKLDIHDRTFPDLRLIQVKTDKRNPYDHFGPKEREALIALADQTGGTPELWWWPANKPCKVIAESEWPRPKVAA